MVVYFDVDVPVRFGHWSRDPSANLSLMLLTMTASVDHRLFWRVPSLTRKDLLDPDLGTRMKSLGFGFGAMVDSLCDSGLLTPPQVQILPELGRLFR